MTISIVWFKQDLRIQDNESIIKASNLGNILPIYIYSEEFTSNSFKMGKNSKQWLYHSLNSLNNSLENKLNIYQGKPFEIILELCNQHNIKNIFWNKLYEFWNLKQEEDLINVLNKNSINFEISNSNHLWDYDQILKNDEEYYKVFTPFKKKAYMTKHREPMLEIKNMKIINKNLNSLNINDLNLITSEDSISKHWKIGEKEAQIKLEEFIQISLNGYKTGRDYPNKKNVSKLSPHIHFGEISPSQIWSKIKQNSSNYSQEDVDHFLNEITWREFSYYLLHHFKELHTKNFNSKFDDFPWIKNDQNLNLWKEGKTGYPIIDAGMRELREIGYMHNRVRMIVASFLIKNLNIHWHYGRDWFWENLVDADLANNSSSWQWVAGSGADAAPYFRIFNCTTQGEKFDSNGEYTKKYVPELKNLPNEYLFKPWEASKFILLSAEVELGKNYPYPIVDLTKSRNQALENYKNLN